MSRIDILRHEWRLMLRERVALPALLALSLLLLFAAFNGRAVVEDQERASAALVTEAEDLRAALAAQAERATEAATSPGSVGYSVYAAPVKLPPAALAGLAIGQSDLLPTNYAVTARGAYRFLAAPPLDNPLRLAFGGFDATFVLVFILPLVIIALTFDVVSGERERGVWPIAVAQGASILPLVLSKCVARGVAVLATLLVVLPITALVSGFALRQDGALLRLGIWILAALGYAVFWIALALWVNSRPRASDQNAALLAGTWLLFAVVGPPAINLVATTWYPAPSRVALTTELREATAAADQAAARDRDRYFFDHPEMQGGDMDQTAYFQSVARSEREIDAAMRPLLAEFDLRAARQRAVVDALQYSSPATLIYRLSTTLAGSDGTRHQAFREQAVDFHDAWSNFFAQRLARGARLSVADYASWPTFEFREPRLDQALLWRVWLPFSALLAATLALVLHAMRRLRRFPVG